VYVYFLKTVVTGREGSLYKYKIGHAGDVVKRIGQLQTGCPAEIALFGTLKCKSKKNAAEVERSLHEYFADRRHLGEWFQFSARNAWAIRLLMRDWPIATDIKTYMDDAHKQAQRIKDVLYTAKLPVWRGIQEIENLDRNEFIDRIRLLVNSADSRSH
jgi:hypothetical protein